MEGSNQIQRDKVGLEEGDKGKERRRESGFKE